MSNNSSTFPASHPDEFKASWVPMLAIALAQILMSFNVASLPIALSGMVRSFAVPPTAIATAIVVYSLSVAAFVMLGAKLNQRFGPLQVFRYGVLLFGVAMLLVTLSPNATIMIAGQGLAGIVAAGIVPALVALIAENYRGLQQAKALGVLGSARAAAGVSAFLIGGILGTYVGWRPVFGLLIGLAIIIFILSFRMQADEGRKDVQIDLFGVVLAAASIILLSFGFNNINRWGLFLASEMAPFSILRLSPALMMLIAGLILGQAFMSWSRSREKQNKMPLLALEVIESVQERAAVVSMFAIVALEGMLFFAVPLYIQIVQGNTPMASAIAMMPFSLSVFFSATLIVRFYNRFTPRQIGRYSFILCTIALLWLALVMRNNWSELAVLIGLVIFGIGQGSLVTLMFNVLVTSSPKALAGDVGSLRGVTNNLAGAIGTAASAAILVALLSVSIMYGVTMSPIITPELSGLIDLNNLNFVSNDHLFDVLSKTSATAEQIAEAVRLNEISRLWALKVGLLIMAVISLLAIYPVSRLPDYVPGEIPADNLKK